MRKWVEFDLWSHCHLRGLFNLKAPGKKNIVSRCSFFFFFFFYWKFLDNQFLFLKTEVIGPIVFPYRFHSFLLFMGHPPYAIREVNINKFCRIISEFALEYRTTRERVLQQKQKRANHRERNKTRGKMITDVSFRKLAYLFWECNPP